MRIVSRTWGSLLACALALGVTGLARPALAQGEAWLGVYLQEITPELRDGMNYNGPGVLVRRVVSGSPADRAGIERGDVIVRFASRDVGSASELTRAVRGMEPGRQVRVDVVRDGDRKSLDVTLEARDTDAAPEAPEAPQPPSMGHDRDDDTPPLIHGDEDDTPPAPDVHEHHNDSDDDEDTPTPPPTGRVHIYGMQGDHDHVMQMPDMQHMMGMMGRGRLGVRVENLTPDLASYFGPRGMKGALVLEVTDDSPAAKAGVRAGDVITRFDSKPIGDADDLIEAVRSSEGEATIALIRHGSHETLSAHLDAMPKGMQFRSGPGTMQWRSFGPGTNGDGTTLSPQDRERLREEVQQLRQQVRDLRNQLRDRDRSKSRDSDRDRDRDQDEDTNPDQQ